MSAAPVVPLARAILQAVARNPALVTNARRIAAHAYNVGRTFYDNVGDMSEARRLATNALNSSLRRPYSYRSNKRANDVVVSRNVRSRLSSSLPVTPTMTPRRMRGGSVSRVPRRVINLHSAVGQVSSGKKYKMAGRSRRRTKRSNKYSRRGRKVKYRRLL